MLASSDNFEEPLGWYDKKRGASFDGPADAGRHGNLLYNTRIPDYGQEQCTLDAHIFR